MGQLMGQLDVPASWASVATEMNVRCHFSHLRNGSDDRLLEWSRTVGRGGTVGRS